MNRELFDYIASCPTPYHAVEHTARTLEQAGYLPLFEGELWKLEQGKGYYVTRGGSSIIAFRLPKGKPRGFMISAAHCDSPTFHIKENAELESEYIKLSTEKYGGAIYSTWLDRPLSVAGRVTIKTREGFKIKTVDFKDICAVIPNVAIHMNRNVNTGYNFDPSKDTIPLFCEKDQKGSFAARAAKEAKVKPEDIISWDLMLYNPQTGVEWNGFISAPRLDDLQCAFASLKAFMEAKECRDSIPVCCIFDNEEVGSHTKQGAASSFLRVTLERISLAFGEKDMPRLLARSFMASCDNAHAVHPNHPEFRDPNHAPVMNGGIVIKHNANQKYTTDAVSAAIFRLICQRAGVKTQDYSNRADLAGGGTLGNIANSQVSLNTVDIGLAQLAMHSCLETAGARDTKDMVTTLKLMFSSSLDIGKNGEYKIK